MHYLVLPYLLLFSIYFFFVSNTKQDSIKNAAIIYLFWVSVFIFLFGMLFQPLRGDNYAYSIHFKDIIDLNFSDMLNLDKPELGYRLLNWIVGLVTSNYLIFSSIVFIIFYYLLFISIKIIYPSFEKYFVLYMYILYPYSMAYVVSGKRQGIALVLMLLSISYIINNKTNKGLIFLLLIPFFHYGSSIIIPFILMFILFKNKNIFIISMIIFLLSLLISLFHINEMIFTHFSSFDLFKLDQRYLSYFQKEGEFSEIAYITGFRIKFVLFSMFPLILYWIFRKKIKSEYKQQIIYLLSIYLLLNSIYNFLSSMVFNDRFGTFSWFILPLVSYSILRGVNKQYAVIFSILFIFAEVVLLQTYTSKYLQPLGIL